jgi:hypothetical protein
VSAAVPGRYHAFVWLRAASRVCVPERSALWSCCFERAQHDPHLGPSASLLFRSGLHGNSGGLEGSSDATAASGWRHQVLHETVTTTGC